MDNINKDTLVKLISYFIIVFLLSMVLYLMYIDFLSETFFGKVDKFSNSNINQKLKQIDTNKVEYFNQMNPLIFDPNAEYILKKDLLPSNVQNSVINAMCDVNDIQTSDGKCRVNSNNFYLSSSASNRFSIKVLPLGTYTTPDSNNYSYYNYDVTITDVTPNDKLSIIRKTYFYFPDDNTSTIYNNIPRNFTYLNKYDKGILNYFNNHAKYKNHLKFKGEPADPVISNINSPTQDDVNIIKTYFSYLSDLLLLTNSPSTNKSPFVYNSGYDFDFNKIKTKLISLYNNLINKNLSININMEINDATNIVFIYDSIINMNVYAIELNPSIVVTFNNIILTFDEKMPSNIKQGSIWSLNYITKLTPIDNNNELIFTYSDMIIYPLAIPLATPKMSLTDDWLKNTTNGVIFYFENIFKGGKLNNVRIMDITKNNKEISDPGDSVAINNLTELLKYIGNTNLINILDIFLLFDPKTNIAQTWVITDIIDDDTKKKIVAPLLYVSSVYSPINCNSELNYDSKCVPKCPAGFDYDLGLICLNSNPKMYLPGTSFCNYINSLDSDSDDTSAAIYGLKLSCDKKYFDKNKLIYQVEITGPDFKI